MKGIGLFFFLGPIKNIFKKDNKGVVLIIVIAIVAIMTVMITQFGDSETQDLQLAYNFRDSFQAQEGIRGATEFAIALLTKDKPKYFGEDQDWFKFSEFLLGASSYLGGAISMTGTINDECSKININKLLKVNADGKLELDKYRVYQFKNLMIEVLQIDIKDKEFEEFINCIADWIDDDDTVSFPGGAETEYYQTLSPPYKCKDAPMDTIEELFLIKGMKKEWFDGTKQYKGIKDFITVYSNGTINVNTASKEVLQSISNVINPTDIDTIIADRKDKPYDKPEKLKEELKKTSIEEDIMNDKEIGVTDFASFLTDNFNIGSIDGGAFSINVKCTTPAGAEMNGKAVLKVVNNKAEIVYYRLY